MYSRQPSFSQDAGYAGGEYAAGIQSKIGEGGGLMASARTMSGSPSPVTVRIPAANFEHSFAAFSLYPGSPNVPSGTNTATSTTFSTTPQYGSSGNYSPDLRSQLSVGALDGLNTGNEALSSRAQSLGRPSFGQSVAGRGYATGTADGSSPTLSTIVGLRQQIQALQNELERRRKEKSKARALSLPTKYSKLKVKTRAGLQDDQPSTPPSQATGTLSPVSHKITSKIADLRKDLIQKLEDEGLGQREITGAAGSEAQDGHTTDPEQEKKEKGGANKADVDNSGGPLPHNPSDAFPGFTVRAGRSLSDIPPLPDQQSDGQQAAVEEPTSPLSFNRSRSLAATDGSEQTIEWTPDSSTNESPPKVDLPSDNTGEENEPENAGETLVKEENDVSEEIDNPAESDNQRDWESWMLPTRPQLLLLEYKPEQATQGDEEALPLDDNEVIEDQSTPQDLEEEVEETPVAITPDVFDTPDALIQETNVSNSDKAETASTDQDTEERSEWESEIVEAPGSSSTSTTDVPDAQPTDDNPVMETTRESSDSLEGYEDNEEWVETDGSNTEEASDQEERLNGVTWEPDLAMEVGGSDENDDFDANDDSSGSSSSSPQDGGEVELSSPSIGSIVRTAEVGVDAPDGGVPEEGEDSVNSGSNGSSSENNAEEDELATEQRVSLELSARMTRAMRVISFPIGALQDEILSDSDSDQSME